MMRRLGFVLLGATQLWAQEIPTGEQVLGNIEQGMAGIKDYTATLEVVSNISRTRVPPMHVKVFYKQPERFHFESESFALLPREGLSFSAARIMKRFSVEAVEEIHLEEGRHLLLRLRPNDQRTRSLRMMLYVDPVRWKPTRMESSLFDGRTVSVDFEYEDVGGFIVPSLLTVRFESAGTDTADQAASQEEVGIPRPRFPRTGTVSVRYSDYKINTGLPDEIFTRKKQ
jgi:outer membrane lipoprotein-sorting protein